MKVINGAEFFTYAETADRISVSVATVKRWVKAKKLKVVPVGSYPMVPGKEIEAFKKAILDAAK